MAAGITTRQAVELVSAAVGWKVSLGKMGRVIKSLSDDERMSASWEQEALLVPEDVDRIAGLVWMWRTGYWQRRNVKGDYEAWVECAAGEWRLLMLPFERVWNQATKSEDMAIAQTIEMWTWPTGTKAGVLARVEDRDGLPTYSHVLGATPSDIEP